MDALMGLQEEPAIGGRALAFVPLPHEVPAGDFLAPLPQVCCYLCLSLGASAFVGQACVCFTQHRDGATRLVQHVAAVWLGMIGSAGPISVGCQICQSARLPLRRRCGTCSGSAPASPPRAAAGWPPPTRCCPPATPASPAPAQGPPWLTQTCFKDCWVDSTRPLGYSSHPQQPRAMTRLWRRGCSGC